VGNGVTIMFAVEIIVHMTIKIQVMKKRY